VRSVQDAQDALRWMLSDHLGSASVTANEDGASAALTSEQHHPVHRILARCVQRAGSPRGLWPGDYRYTGQLEQAELGLYYYVARWYDPIIAHFAQADTIVPSPGNAVAYDRYAYVINNPILLNDPSGHYAVEESNSKFDKLGSISSHRKLLEYVLPQYEVTYDERYTTNDLSEIYQAVYAIGKLFADDAVEGFTKAYDEIGIYASSGEGTYCQSGGYGFTCTNYVGKLDRYLVAHELGHTFNATISNRGSKVTPYETLRAASIRTVDGVWVTGLKEDGSWLRGFDGYFGDHYPHVQHGMDWEDWNTENEEWADMFMYQTFDLYVENKSGDARRSWMTATLKIFIP